MVIAKTKARITIPVQRHESVETIWNVLPWFLRKPDQVPAPRSPQLLTFTKDQFMPAFFQAIEQIDSGLTSDGFEKLIPFRDFSEPPAGMLDTNNLPLYPSSIQREFPLLLDAEDNTGGWTIDDDGVPRDNPAWLRKLYLPLHLHFHLVTTELVCKRVKFPKVRKNRIIESGMIVRRLVADKNQERWQDWIAGPEGHGVWLEIADTKMHSHQNQTGQPLDPGALSPILFGDTIQQELLAYRLGLDSLDLLPRTLTRHRMNLIPSSVGRANDHTVFFGYLPLQSNDQILPELQDDPVMLRCVGERLAHRALRVLGELFFAEPRFDGTLPKPLPAHIIDHLKKLDASMWKGVNQPEQNFDGVLVLFRNTFLPAKPANMVADDLIERIGDFDHLKRPLEWKQFIQEAAYIGLVQMIDLLMQQVVLDDNSEKADDPEHKVNKDLQPRWWDYTVDRKIINAVRNQLPQKWTQDAIHNRQHDFKNLFLLTVYKVLDALRDFQRTSAPWDKLNLNEPPGVDHVNQLIVIALIRIRAYRKHLLKGIYEKLESTFTSPKKSDLNRTDENNDPMFTVAAYSDEITAWIEAERERVLGTKQWEWPSMGLFDHNGNLKGSLRDYAFIHLQHATLESYLSGFEQTMAHADGAISDVVASRLKSKARLRGMGFDISEQASRGLLGIPGFPVQPDALAGVINEVVELYDQITNVQSKDGKRARAIAEKAQRLRRSKYDSESLYAVWVYHRVAGHTPCEQEKIIWSGPSDIFSIAEPTDVLGAKPVAFQLPDLPKLIKNIPRIPRAKALPYAAVKIPKNSNVKATSLENIARSWGMSLVCTYGIPVFTICAWVAFQIIFNILLFFGFGWFLFLKFCFPGSSRN